ncbi:MAG: ParB/RepB/Spo0J family partition protein [bacterium]
MAKDILGRGLSSLIPPKKIREAINLVAESPVAVGLGEERVEQIPIEKITANPHQPRQSFGQGQLDELIDSIKEYGIIQPLIVTRTKDGYQLIAGERRWRAAKFLDFKTVPAIVRQADEQEKLELSLIENVQRADLNPIEVALAYQLLIDEFNFTPEEVGRKVGKATISVVNQLRLLNLEKEIQQALINGRIAAGHGKVLAGVADSQARFKFFKRILQEQLNVRDTENISQARPGKKYFRPRDPNLASWEENLQKVLSTKVKIEKKKDNTGRILVEFYSIEELGGIIKKITNNQ